MDCKKYNDIPKESGMLYGIRVWLRWRCWDGQVTNKKDMVTYVHAHVCL